VSTPEPITQHPPQPLDHFRLPMCHPGIRLPASHAVPAAYRDGKRVTRATLVEIADQFQNWVKNPSEERGAPVLETREEERRDAFVLPYLILGAIGRKDNDSPPLEYKQPSVNPYNFYLTNIGGQFRWVCFEIW
jgi:hypothetical protein